MGRNVKGDKKSGDGKSNGDIGDIIWLDGGLEAGSIIFYTFTD